MTLSPRQLWIGVALGIVGLIAGYTTVLIAMNGTEVFAAPVSCTGHRNEPCNGDNCPGKETCKNGNCGETCPGCAGAKAAE